MSDSLTSSFGSSGNAVSAPTSYFLLLEFNLLKTFLVVLGICSVAFQPALHEENPNMSFDQYLEAAKEMVPLDEIGDYFSELQVGHDVHFDMEEQNSKSIDQYQCLLLMH